MRSSVAALLLCVALPACLPAGETAPGLAGGSWQLVQFQGSDDTTVKPDDKAKYTTAFGTDGSVAVRVDCNRGRGTWKSAAPGRLEFGPLALTRAACPPGSMHDRIVKDWPFVRSYVVKDGHLFLALMADGGIYEFEPTAAAKPVEKRDQKRTTDGLALSPPTRQPGLAGASVAR